MVPLSPAGGGDPSHATGGRFPYRSAAHFIDVFRTWHRPVHKVSAALPADRASALEHDLSDLRHSTNRTGSAFLVVPSEYLEVVIARR